MYVKNRINIKIKKKIHFLFSVHNIHSASSLCTLVTWYKRICPIILTSNFSSGNASKGGWYLHAARKHQAYIRKCISLQHLNVTCFDTT